MSNAIFDRAGSWGYYCNAGVGSFFREANAFAALHSELSFRQGDIVQVIAQLDENWIEGEYNNRTGIAPASYFEV